MRMSRKSLVGLAAVTGLLAMAAALWLVLLQPRIATAASVKQQSVQVEQANLALLKRHREILDLAAQAPAMAREAQRLFSRMPETAQLPQVLQQINAAARASGISTRNIQLISTSIPTSVTAPEANGSAPAPGGAKGPGKAVAGAAAAATTIGVNLATMTLEVTVNGTSWQRAAFLGRLQSLDRGFLITAHNAVSDGTNKDTGMLTVNGTMFVLESKLPDLVANAQSIIARAQQEAALTPPKE